jgi:hypothetical protein
MKYKIIANRARCKLCGWILESQSDFHLNVCDCGKTSVDGGLKELRRYGDMNNIEELSETGVSDSCASEFEVLTND